MIEGLGDKKKKVWGLKKMTVGFKKRGLVVKKKILGG